MFKDLPDDEKKTYLKTIDDKNQDLLDRFEDTPPGTDNKNLRWRIASDIEQTKWRSAYLHEHL